MDGVVSGRNSIAAALMIRYSHVSLLIPCDAESAQTITATLGAEPTIVRKSMAQIRGADGGLQESTYLTWTLDSPKSRMDGDPIVRLHALADSIEPFASRLPSIRPQFRPVIDILYHLTPQHPHGVTGEFDLFWMPADLMRRLGAWDLSVSYEAIWFDHPDWVIPTQQGWWSRILESLRIRRNPRQLAPQAGEAVESPTGQAPRRK
jgi:hypothetical protein